jgi:dolichol-phosphate mannosyltransferase
MVMIMLGIIGEYVWRVFDEVTKRPEVVVDEVY